jgi:steroid delta-isomerase-like uncharacterized protein
LAPGAFSDFMDVDPGEHTVAITPHGEGLEAAVIGPVAVALAANHRYTIAVRGQMADESLEPLVIDETKAIDGVDMATHNFRIIINNIAGSPPISFYEEGRLLEKNVAYGEYSALAIEPFSWDTGRAVAGENLDEIIFPFDLEDDDAAGYWEPYTVYVYGMMGKYPGQPDEDYTFAMPSVYSVAPDLPSFLAAFTPFELTADYQTYLHFETFGAALEKTGLNETLAKGGPYTIFVPTDAAFASFSQHKLAALLEDPAALKNVLLNHVVQGAMSYEAMLEAGKLTTLGGTVLPVVESSDEELTFGLGDNAEVYNFPYTFADGSVVYFIRNQVLLPALSEEQNLAIVQRFYDEFAQGNADVILDVYAEKITMHYAGSVEEVSAQTLRDDLAALKKANPDLRAEIQAMFARGDIVVTELTWTATHTGDYFGVPATGKTTAHPGIVVRRLQDSKIVESWEMWDDLTFLNSVGYLPTWDEIIANPPATEATGEIDPAAVIKAFVAAGNAHDLDATLELFADDAVLKFANTTEAYVGKERIRAWLLADFRNSIHYTFNHYQVAGNKVTFMVTVSLHPEPHSAEVVVEDGKIKSWDIIIFSDLIKAYQAALRAGDIDAALALFADDATITYRADNQVFAGKEQLRELFQDAVASNFDSLAISAYKVVADAADPTLLKATWSYRSKGDLVEELGLTPGRGQAEAATQNGKIKSITYTNALE